MPSKDEEIPDAGVTMLDRLTWGNKRGIEVMTLSAGRQEEEIGYFKESLADRIRCRY